MFLYSAKMIRKKISIIQTIVRKSYLYNTFIRKEKLSPPNPFARKQSTGAFFFAPLRAVLTVEAAIILPLFLFFMIAAMQYAAAMETAVKFGTALADTGKSLAAASYVTKYGGNTEGVSEMAAGVLTAAYAKGQILSKAGDTSAVKNTNLLLSSFLEEDEMIDLVLTYQIRTPIGAVKLPGNFFIQRARVRAWTGREGSENADGSGKEDGEEDYVYVAATGSVYHEDPDCTHLKLSIREIDPGALDTLRNNNGGIYHSCEKCGNNSAGGTVYITKEGNRYHTSLSCSGLKRTVRQVRRDSLDGMRVCSKCGKSVGSD